VPSPEVVNRRPLADEEDVAVETLIRLGLRDQDTAVDADSVYAALLYAPTTYRALFVPDDDPVFEGEGVEQDLIVFNDTAYSPAPNTPNTTSVLTVLGEPVYRTVRDVVGGESCLYFTAPVVLDCPVGVAVRVAIDTTIPGLGYGAYSYVTWSDFTGVVIGFVYWPRATGLFLFFRDDGVNQRITIAGPATDALGTRIEFATQVFTWSAESFTYRILWDETSGRDAVVVSAIGTTTETVLFTGTISAMYPFLGGVKIGSDYEAADRVGLVVGTDGPLADALDVYTAALFSFGGACVRNGLPVMDTLTTVESDAAILLAEVTWTESGTGTFADSTVTRTDTDASDTFTLVRDEPALFRREWVVYAGFRGVGGTHPGTYDTGMGLVIEDGASLLSLRLYDDFVTHTLGFLHGDADQELDYEFPATDVEWEETTSVVLSGSGVRNLVRMWANGVLATTFGYNAVDYPVSTERRVSVGFIPAGHTGSLDFDYFWVLTAAECFESVDGSFPEVQGWVRDSSGGARSWTPSLLTDCRGVGDYDKYSRSSADFGALSGTVVVLEARVVDWVSGSSVNPYDVAIGPIAMGTAKVVSGAQLCFTMTESGRMYAYIPALDAEATLTDVLRQTAEGRARSAEVDFTVVHTYLLYVQPLSYVRLYVDFELAIDIPWSTTSGFDLPLHGLGAAYAAFGALATGVHVEFANVRAAFGRGYDLALGLDLTEAEKEAYVFDSEVEVYVDVEDT